jgi:DUF917 family protein
MKDLNWNDVRAAVRGGSFYASGGGGWVDHGLEIGKTAIELGTPRLASIDELQAHDIVITVSAIGAPAAKDWQMLAEDYIHSVRLLSEAFQGKVVGTITPQNGCSSSINGWVQSAALGTVVVDAVGDMRAHPTGKMGSLGLAQDPNYQTIQVAVGGSKDKGRYLEVVARGSVAATANILRVASVESGSFITCARHPVDAKFIAEKAALGGITQAMRLGEAMLYAEAGGTEAVLEAIVENAAAEIVGRGRVLSNDYLTQGAFDLGRCVVQCGHQQLTLHTMNEWMAIDDQDGQRLSTYPDVICVLSARTGLPLNVFQVLTEMDVVIMKVAKQHLALSAGVFDPSVYPEVETALGISIASYALE